jgi:RNA polymerase-binding transcription factor DksA
MSDALTAGQRALLEASLEQQRSTLEKQIAQQLDGASRPEHARDLLQQDGDDAPARDADREVDLARSDLEIAELRDVHAALARLKAGHYGLCVDCDQPIPFDRLRRTPHALRCVTCQSAYEARSGQIVHRTTL